MAKAVLVMDMPESCNKCKLYDSEYDFCVSSNKYVRSFEKPSWCPLKPMPEKKEGWFVSEHGRGFNACIDAICGKE